MRDSLDRSVRFTRRTATVTMSAPEASWQRCISWKLRYFPVPTINRERNSRPAIIKVSDMLPIVAAPIRYSVVCERGRVPGSLEKLLDLRPAGGPAEGTAVVQSPETAQGFLGAAR